MNKKLAFTILSVIYIALLLLGGTILKVNDVSKAPGFDKVLHFFGFFVLTILLLLTFEYYELNNKYLASMLIAFGIGLVIEAVQLGIPGREFSLLDLAADTLGIIVGAIIRWIFPKL
jgi:VanZ family protein